MNYCIIMIPLSARFVNLETSDPVKLLFFQTHGDTGTSGLIELSLSL